MELWLRPAKACQLASGYSRELPGYAMNILREAQPLIRQAVLTKRDLRRGVSSTLVEQAPRRVPSRRLVGRSPESRKYSTPSTVLHTEGTILN
jgi:hypothetical protein